MRGLFRYRGPVYNGLMMMTNMMILNLLFILFSIPIITLGASLSSLYTTVDNLLTDSFSTVVEQFIRNFRDTFYRGTKVFFTLSLSYFIVVVLIYYAVISKIKILTFLMLFVFSIILLITFVIFPIGALYEGDFKLVLNNTAVFMHTDLMISIFIFLISVIFYILIPIFIPRLIILHLLFGFSGMAFIQTKIVKKRLV